MPPFHEQQLDSARIAELLPGADDFMDQAICLRSFPDLSREQMDYIITTVSAFEKSRRAHV